MGMYWIDRYIDKYCQEKKSPILASVHYFLKEGLEQRWQQAPDGKEETAKRVIKKEAMDMQNLLKKLSTKRVGEKEGTEERLKRWRN